MWNLFLRFCWYVQRYNGLLSFVRDAFSWSCWLFFFLFIYTHYQNIDWYFRCSMLRQQTYAMQSSMWYDRTHLREEKMHTLPKQPNKTIILKAYILVNTYSLNQAKKNWMIRWARNDEQRNNIKNCEYYPENKNSQHTFTTFTIEMMNHLSYDYRKLSHEWRKRKKKVLCTNIYENIKNEKIINMILWI